jgi:hypothetical protein
MGEEELKKEKMQALFDYEETCKELNARRAQAARIGDELRRAGESLRNDPACMFFNGESIPMELMPLSGLDAALFDIAKIKEVCSAIRDLTRKREHLEERKHQLGYK